MSPVLEKRCAELLAELGITNPGDSVEAVPLSGGVASDIAKVTAGGHDYCVKFALPKLKVQADWYAPIHRNAAEYAWLKVAADIAPESAIALYGCSTALHGFAMEYLGGENTYLWKSHLLAESPDKGEAAMVGRLLGRIHAASVQSAFNAHMFQNPDDFHALRIEPYLLFTAIKHRDIAPNLEHIATQLGNGKPVLVHGDVSPKNILFRGTGPIILDAECATMGDASFDPAFCLNHLVLKAIHLSESREQYLRNAVEFWRAYSSSITWEPEAILEARICKLLPALMLGRVDGKSPVEYLSKRTRETVRHIARQFIISPASQLDELVQGIGNLSTEMGT